MRNSVFAQIISGALGLTALASTPLTFAVAHQDHKMECNETSINAMDDGEAKTTAMGEMAKAEQMMAGKDMEACTTHMHSAMEAMEK